MDNNIKTLNPLPPALPATLEGWHRQLKTKRNLNDHVEDIHRALLESNDAEQYKQYLYATWDEYAVEGSMDFDDFRAAEMIRNQSKTIDGNPIKHEKLSVVVKSLKVVLRRYRASRRERRDMIGGEIVPDDE